MSYMSVRSVSSGTCSNSSHWSTPAPLTPTYFPNAVENPLPPLKPAVEVNLTTYRADVDDSEDEDRMEIIADVDAVESTPKRARQTTAQRTQSPVSSSSPSPYDVATPSPSIHQYSSALRQTMRARYDEAFKRMNSGDGKMALDLSWEDEDPIDRHVRMSTLRQEAESRRRKAAASTSDRQVLDGMPMESDPMLGKAGPSSRMLDDGLPPARPTLLDFRGYSHLNTSSFGSRSDEDAECGHDDDTPGSIASEASFEAGSKEDWVDMYGRSLSGGQVSETIPSAAPEATASVAPPLDSPNITFRMSQASISTYASNDTTSSQATILPPRSTSSRREQPTRLNSFGIGTRPSPSPGLPYLQPCEHSPSHMFQPLGTPAPLSQLANGYFAIPTQPAPAPVSRSYPKRPTMGTRQRSRNHPYANALEKQRERDLSSNDVNTNTNARLAVPVLACATPDSQTGEAHAYPERSESEMMVLLAGLRSQRSRAAARA